MASVNWDELPRTPRFRIRVAGDSMEPNVLDGDAVCVQTVRHQSKRLFAGEFYVVMRKHRDAMLARLVKAGPKILFFDKINKAKYPKAIKVKRSEIHCMAVVYEIARPVKMGPIDILHEPVDVGEARIGDPGWVKTPDRMRGALDQMTPAKSKRKPATKTLSEALKKSGSRLQSSPAV
jgi:hypothetical protein